MSEPLKLNYTVSASDFASVGSASADVKARLKHIGMPADVIRRTVIALYEAEINLAIHAEGGTIEVSVSPDEVKMLVQDDGPGIADVELAMSEGYSTATDDVRNLGFGAGMGLPNMKRYTDTFEIESELGVGTTIRMSVLIK